jgi:hypothetical protein
LFSKLIGDRYQIGKKYYPRLSQIVEQVPNIALRNWKKRVGEEVAREISEEASEWGNAVHKITEYSDHYNCKKIDDMLTEAEDNCLILPLLAWESWVDEYVSKWIAIERIVWSDKLIVAGTIDRVGKLKEDKCLSICDLKTGALYDEIGIRLFGYRLMWNERNPKKKVTRCLAVNLPRKVPGEVKVREYIDNSKNRYEERFIQLCKDYHTLIGD